MNYHGYTVSNQDLNTPFARFDDELTPDLTPGGQRRAALRVARKMRSAGYEGVIVRGYMGGLGVYEMEDEGEDLTPRPADFTSTLVDW
jgi:hypothetical protein